MSFKKGPSGLPQAPKQNAPDAYVGKLGTGGKGGATPPPVANNGTPRRAPK